MFSQPTRQSSGTLSSGGLSKEIEISLAGRNLPDLDVLSKSDPMCVMYVQPFGQNQWQEFGRTETILNNSNPNFAKKMNIIYRFEELQKLKFEVYDVDSSRANLLDHDLIGWTEVTLGNIVSQRVIKQKLDFFNKSLNRGMLIICAEELSSNKEEVDMQIVAHNLDKKSWFFNSSPFLVISKSTENGDYIVVHKTEHIRHNLNPIWKPIQVPVRLLCNGDYDRTLKVECYDWRHNGHHKFIGETFTSLRKILDGPTPMKFPFISQKKKERKGGYTNSGQMEVVSCQIKPIYTFLDYIQGGTEINCTIAIDFTASNGNPNNPESLHYTGYAGTLYEQALSAVGQIIEDYDSDKQFPVLGFGAKIPPSGMVSHEFHVNFNPQNPYCNRISGVIAAYRSCLASIQLYGPTNFAPCIRHVANFAKQYQNGSNYFILLILTDGVITDMYDTIDTIVNSSCLPLSIIIVGIGNADFSAMEELDSDNKMLTSPSGKKATRDIVQFVPFNQFLTSGLNPSVARLHLAREVLREIPDQFIGFMKSRNITPQPPRYGLDSLPPDPEMS